MCKYLITAVLAFFTISFCISGLTSASEPIVAYESSILWGGCYNVAVYGDYALYVKSYGLEIADITDPSNPALVSNLVLAGECRDLAISGDIAYVAHSESGVHIVDISDPAAPSHIGSYSTLERCIIIEVHNDLLYYCVGNGDVQIVDVADPANPQYVTTIYTPDEVRGFAFEGAYVFITEGPSGLEVYDISTPSAPILVGSFDGTAGGIDASYRSIAISGDYAFIADYAYSTESHPGGFQVLNISDPTDIYRETIYPIHLLYDLVLVGNTVYISTQTTGLHSFDVSDPVNPVLLDNVTETEYVKYLAPHDSYLLSASSVNNIYDISDPVNIDIVYEDPMLSQNCGLSLYGNYAYISHFNSGLTVVDITDPLYPEAVANYPTTTRTNYLREHNDLLYVTSSDGLRIYDLVNPAAPVEIGFAADTDTSSLEEVTIVGDYAYITGCPNDMCIFDISDPYNPTLEAVYSPTVVPDYSKRVENVAVHDSYAYISNSNTYDLFIVDVSDPTAPVGVGSYTLPFCPVKTTFVSGYALVSGFLHTEILDISDPVNPVSVGQMSFASQNEPAVYGDFLLAPNETSPDDGFYIYNIADFPNYYSLGRFETPDEAWELETDGDHLFITDWSAFLVMSLNLPEFRAGDANNDGNVDIGDAVSLISYIFKGGAAPTPLEAGDANCDGDVNVGDAVTLVNYIFNGGAEPCYAQ